MTRLYRYFILLVFFLPVLSFSQQDSIEVYLIDSFIPPDNPGKFFLSFYTSEECKSTLLIQNKIEIPVSKELAENHHIDVDLLPYKIKETKISFTILVENAEGEKNLSEEYEVDVPSLVAMDTTKNYFMSCLMGGIVFLVPSISYIPLDGKSFWGINKEIPFLSFFGGGYNYPIGHFSLEYSHIYKEEKNKNIFRFGYKHIYEIPVFEYISAGVNGFTNFTGFNGISPEISLGLFKLYNVFTVYSRYRFNFKPGEKFSEYSEYSLGLYASFFTIHF